MKLYINFFYVIYFIYMNLRSYSFSLSFSQCMRTAFLCSHRLVRALLVQQQVVLAGLRLLAYTALLVFCAVSTEIVCGCV